MKYILGVDLGLSGGMALMDENGELVILEKMPVSEIIVNKKKKNQYDLHDIKMLIRRLVDDYGIKTIVFERLRAMPGQMSQTAFSLGYGTAIFRMIATFFNIEYEEVEPRSWQKEMFKGITYGKKDTKVVSLQVASRMFPDYKFGKKDGLSDAALIAAYKQKTL